MYVRSFQNWAGDEAGMAAVFERARQMAPCVLVLEDLDSLINDRNRSFFLNELDGNFSHDFADETSVLTSDMFLSQVSRTTMVC